MVHVKSLLPDPISLPAPTNISAFLLERQEIPNHVLFIDSLTGESWTRARFIDRVRRLQHLLPAPAEQGGFNVQPSEMVAIFSENSVDYVVLMHALWALTIPFAPCSAYATPNELTHCLRITSASTIFCHANRLQATLEAAKAVGIPKSKIFVLDGIAPRGFKTVAQHIGSASFPRELPSKAVPVKQDQLAFVLFSSGTTGLPKAVALSHNNILNHTFQRLGWLQSMLQSASPPRMAPDGGLSVTLGFLPIFHTFGLHSFCITPFFLPGTVVLMPKWDVNKGLDLIPKYKVTTIVAVPSVIHQISTSPKLAKTDMSSVFSLTSGAAYLSSSLSKKLSGQVGDQVRITHGYGLSETTMSAISMTVDGQLGGKWRYMEDCSGVLLPGMEARTVREDGNEAEYGETGELWLKGGNVALGYFGNPKATAETFVDGWLKTGDLFKIDREGYFWYQDRGKDTLKVSGMQVSPMEIEEALLRHPRGLVQDVAVAGVDGALRGSTVVEKVPRAWVVLSDQGLKMGEHKSRQELESWVRQQLSRYKWLKGGIGFIDEIPKSATGKVLRRQLVEEYSKQNPIHVSSRL